MLKILLVIFIIIQLAVLPTVKTNISKPIKKHKKVLPEYCYRYITKFGLDTNLMENWSFAESSHCKQATEHGYYGRYNIGKKWLQDYCRWKDRPFPTNYIKFLENDKNNCYIAYWCCRYFLGVLGYTYKEFFQIWLWGFGNFHKGHYSYSYERKIYRSR